MRKQLVRGVDGEGRVKYWGEVIEDEESGTKVYRTTRMPSHYCWKHEGYGIQLDVFRALQAAGVDDIIVKTRWDTLISSIEVWDRAGVIATLEERYGEQIFLPDVCQEKAVSHDRRGH